MADQRNDKLEDKGIKNVIKGGAKESLGKVQNAVGGLTSKTGEQIKGKATELEGKAQKAFGKAQIKVAERKAEKDAD